MGCRISESIALRPKDFDLEAMTVTIRGKGDKTREVPVSKAAWDAIAVAYINAFLVSSSARLIPLTERAARGVVTRLGKKLGLPRNIASHDLRATFATHILDQTGDIALVQELLGHSNPNTTKSYTLVNRNKMRKAVEF